MTKQCKSCPWKKTCIPERDIKPWAGTEPYSRLKKVICEPGAFIPPKGYMMCHQVIGKKPKVGPDQFTHGSPCVGWLINQLGPGNNLGLRLLAMDGRFKTFRTVGPQHERFEDTIPKGRTLKAGK